VGELISKEEKELLRLRNFGQKSSQEINERLKSLGLSLSPQLKDLTMPVAEETEGEESVPPEGASEASES
jgi:DNA-directed RNA polymerase alpha subunit